MTDLSSLSDDQLTSMYSSMSDDDLQSAYAKSQPKEPDLSSMSDDELKSAYSSMSDDELKAAYNKSRPAPEGMAAANVRAAAHGIIPALGAAAGGAGAGALAGTLGAGPIGTLVGGVVGGVIGGFGGDLAQDKLQDVAPALDDRPQMQANAEEYPRSTQLSGMAAFAGNPGRLAGSLVERGAQAAVMGGIDVAQQLYQKGDVDPTQALEAGAFGAVFPHGNKVTQAVSDKVGSAVRKYVPGRPGRAANPDAAQAHTDVDDPNVETDVNSTSLAQPSHIATGETTGNPQSAPTRSARTYPKAGSSPEDQARYAEALSDPEAMRQFAHEEGLTEAEAREIAQANYEPGDMLTQGEMAPDVTAALQAANPEPAPKFQELPPGDTRADTPQPAGPPYSGGTAEELQNMGAAAGPQVPPRAAAAIKRSRGRMAPDALQEAGAALGPWETPERAEARQTSAAQSGEALDNMKSAIGGLKDTLANVKKPRQGMPEPSVEAGFPQPGEPVATGENEATPMPAAPPIKGRAAEPTEGQKEAGNYFKGRTHDFGKPMAVETHAGQTRSGKDANGETWENVSPYHYGYFNKTKSSDKGANGRPEGIDWARPDESDPAFGDKHFIIDQKDADTGKFDEPKVFTYYKDEAAARDHFNKGFSDGKGPDRLGAITEVSKDDVIAYLAKHTTKAVKKPYGDFEGTPTPAGKPAKELAVVKDLTEKLRAQGKEDEAAKLEAMPDEQLAAAVAGKRTRKYGQGTGASAGYTVEGVLSAEGKPITANSKIKAAARSAMHKNVVDWFRQSAPKKDAAVETRGELLDRIKNAPDPAWKPIYKPAEWMLAHEAKQLLAKPTPDNIAKYRDAERMLRGSEQDVENYRSGNNIEGGIANSRRSGDEAVASATNKMHAPGVNSEEDAAIARVNLERAGAATEELGQYFRGELDHGELSAKARRTLRAMPADVRKAAFEASEGGDASKVKDWLRDHFETGSEGEPKSVKTAADLRTPSEKTIDASDSSLAKIDTGKISKQAIAEADRRRAAEARAKTDADLARPREAFGLVSRETKPAIKPSEQLKAGKGTHIKAIDETEKARIMEALKTANRKAASRDPSRAITAPEEKTIRRAITDLVDKFATDQSGSVDIRKLGRDFARFLRATDLTRFVDNMAKTHHTSYLAKKRGGVRDDYVRSLDEDLHRGGKIDVNHNLNVLEKAYKEWPKGGLDQAARERIFEARDADSAHVDLPGKQPGKTNVESLPAALKALYDKHLAPVFGDNDQFHTNIHALDEKAIGPAVPHHVAHIMNGDLDQFNMLRGKDDPMAQGRYRGLSVHASAAENRKYFALDRDADHARFIIEPTDKGYDLWENRKVSHVRDPNFKFEDGKKFTVTAKDGTKIDYTMRQAMAKEKEANITINKKPVKYFHDAGFAALVTNAQLGAMARHMEQLHRISETPGWKDWTTTNPHSKKVTEEGWAKSNMPNKPISDAYMHPDLKALFDDFAGQPQTNYQKLNAAVTKLIFISPTKHAITNVGGHTIAGRGWDNLSIPKNLSILKDLPFAINSVIHQDPYQRRLNRNGSGTVYGKVITTDMPGQLAKAFGLDIERSPSKWGPVADKLGVPLLDLTNSIYRAAQRSMWAGSDVWMTLRVRELQRKGMPMQQAIIDAERDIPNYRSPTKIFGSRWAAQQFFNNAVFAFSRYHFGMVNAYASMVKGMLHPSSTMGDRVEAAGKLMTIGLMGMVLYPLLDQGWKKLTGNPDAEAARGGPLAIPSHAAKALNGKEDIMAPVRAAATVSPLLSAGAETFYNRDWRGKDIVKPGDVREGARGHVPGIARAVGEFAEHTARGLIAPYNMYATQSKKAPPGETGVVGAAKTLGRTIRNQALDINDVSPAAARHDRMLPVSTHRAVTQDYRHGGSGPFGKLINDVFGR